MVTTPAEQQQSVAPTESVTSSVGRPLCAGCNVQLQGQFVRALGSCYHLNCFKCHDCGQVVAARFFPLEIEGKNTIPLCERDYFRRKNLLCATCGEAIRGSYISAIKKKYHLDHFTCCMCSVVFGPDETYYEHHGNVYCHYHYSSNFAARCGGCKTAILKQFVEVKAGGAKEQWHPECYMIFKSWQIRLAGVLTPDTAIFTVSTPEQVRLQQKLTEEKVNRIWTVLSMFEESAAACISDMLLHVSNQAYIDAVNEAGNFLMHVDFLFAGIDQMEFQMKQFKDTLNLNYNKEPKLLAKKIVNFFSLLSHTQDTGVRQYGTVTQELLSLVTSLAQYMKILIRHALTGALRLEKKHTLRTAIGDFLTKLSDISSLDLDGDRSEMKFDERFQIADIDVKSDLCASCRNSVEEACFRNGTKRWHKQCLNCYTCRKELSSDPAGAYFDAVDAHVLCSSCKNVSASRGFDEVTQLQQYAFLLRVALKRLISLLKVKDDSAAMSAPSKAERKGSKPRLSDVKSVTAQFRAESTTRSKSVSNMDEAKVESSTELRKAYYDNVSKTNGQSSFAESAEASPNPRREIMQSHQPGSIHNVFEGPSPPAAIVTSSATVASSSTPVDIRRGEDPSSPSSPPAVALSTSLPNPKQTIVAQAQKDPDRNWPISPAESEPSKPSTSARADVLSPASRRLYLAELSALEYFMARNVAVLRLHPLVQDQYTVNELLALIREPKRSFWSRFVSTLKPHKKPLKFKADGTFGVAIDVLVDRCGVDTKHGSGLGRLKIPTFVDQAITALKSMDLNAEGIFRKNGNIKNLNIMQEKIDKDPWSVDMTQENPIQVAALIKKFLREMPEPLLTFKLYPLFIFAQKAPNVETKKKILHYTVCLLPKPNRDLLEVLMIFIRLVGQHAAGDSGNKMDLTNLATVIAPNILYMKTKEKADGSRIKDESMFAIEAVKMLLQFQDGLWTVPDDITEFMHNEEIPDDVNAYSAKDIMSKFEKVMSLKKSHSSRDINDPHSPGSADIHDSAPS